jgi:hypothetical protein
VIAIDGGEWLKGAGQFDFLKLPVRNAPYWCVLSPSVALGYRKGARGGAWLARLHDDETGKRVQEKIGKADDTLDADGDAIGQREGVVDAIRATHAETDEDIANIGEDEAMTRRALELLDSGRNDAYEAALAVLREDGRGNVIRFAESTREEVYARDVGCW